MSIQRPSFTSKLSSTKLSLRVPMRLLVVVALGIGSVCSGFAQNTFPSSGFVGIGTLSPGTPLEVGGTIMNRSSTPYLDLYQSGTQEWRVGQLTAGSGAFSLYAAGAANPNIITLLPQTGNVGIGTTNPLERLHTMSSGHSVHRVETTGTTNVAGMYGITPTTELDTISFGGYNTGRFGISTVGWSAAYAYTGGLMLGTYGNADVVIGSNNVDRIHILKTGNIGIGTTAPDKTLTVKGTLHATEVIVDTTVAAKDLKVHPAGWADYVFNDNYHNAPLGEVEQEIKAHGHLPGVPSAAEVAEKGINLGQMEAVLLKKIEELTLHQIDQEKAINALAKENSELRAQIAELRGSEGW